MSVKSTGEAAPESAEIDVGDDILDAAAALLGIKLAGPAASEPTEKPAAPAEETDEPEAEVAAEKPVSTEAAADEADAEVEKPAAETDAEPAELSDEEKAAAKLADETAQFINVKLKDLPEPVRQRVQGVLDARIGKITATARAEQARLETRVEELAEELAEAREKGGAAAPVNLPGVHPLMFAETESALDARLTQIEAFEDFADANREGYEGDATKNEVSWSAEQIRAKLRELQRERDRVIPAARANLRARASEDAGLKQTYAPLFDRKSEEYRSAQALLKTMPELRRHPNVNVLVARLILGERALATLAQPKAAAGSKGTQLAAVIRKAPRVPGAGAPAKGGALDRKADGPDSSKAVSTFMQRPSRAGLEAAAAAFL